MEKDLELLQFPDERLRRVSKPVESFDAGLTALSDSMLRVMYESRGIGLAAPQVGLPWRMFVTRHPDDRQADGGQVIINPTIEILDQEVVEDVEGWRVGQRARGFRRDVRRRRAVHHIPMRTGCVVERHDADPTAARA